MSGSNDRSSAHAYCHDCEWYATPDDHEHADVMTATEAHTTSEHGHMATVGASEEVVDEATSRATTDEIGDREIIPRDELEKTDETEHGPTYRCPRCGWEWVHEYCECPECLWAGMALEGWE